MPKSSAAKGKEQAEPAKKYEVVRSPSGTEYPTDTIQGVLCYKTADGSWDQVPDDWQIEVQVELDSNENNEEEENKAGLFDGNWEPVFETFVNDEEGMEYTTLIMQSGERVYADFASNDWKPFPPDWESKGHFKVSEYTKEHLRRAEEQDYSVEQIGELLGQIQKMGEAQRHKDQQHQRELNALQDRISEQEKELHETVMQKSMEIEQLKTRLKDRENTQHSSLDEERQRIIAMQEEQQLFKTQSEERENKLTEANQQLNERIEKMAREHAAEVSSLEAKIADLLRTQAEVQGSAQSQQEDFSVRVFQAEREVESLRNKLADAERENARVSQEYSKVLAEKQHIEKAAHEEKQALRQNYHAKMESQSKAMGLVRQKIESSLRSEVERLKLVKKSLYDMVVRFTQAVRDELKENMNVLVQYVKNELTNVEAIKVKYRNEMNKRKALFNQLQELQGNIRVYCRCRNLLPAEMQQSAASKEPFLGVRFDEEDEITVVDRMNIPRKYEFTKVYGMSSQQTDVFEGVRDLITSCMDGYKVCILAYGQTGAGKTFTMMGPADNRGVNVRALQELFGQAEERRDEWTCEVKCSFIEIYNEKIRDLFSSEPPESQKYEIRQGPDGPHVPDLVEKAVTSAGSVVQLITLGEENRTTHATAMNALSSRSHSLLIVKISTVNKTTGLKREGSLTLVDLAGSERVDKSGASGQRLIEAQNINKSLAALGNVISGLRAGQTHIPYRDSKLTYLLQPSLSGDAKVLLFVNVSPKASDADETQCTLKFGERCQNTSLHSEGNTKIPKMLGSASGPGAKPAAAGKDKALPSIAKK